MKGQKGYVLLHKGSALRFSLRGLIHTLQRWRQLAWERNELAQMSDDALKDIGMSRADVTRETERPFWDDPMKK
ncbi:MAG: DUF1127 domain-containing protein [Pseudomonas sp.]|uniref:DUF1127 domain-containing protein n=1 Tax=Pseudomonas abieticivorans TaxID=2931382 RepID=UPI0020BFA33D|nr:DUF1127 domain-containing protein [Pseudomonas sp. PIA16]MDE1164156.1 DUF1127 domain-containing protein [Pseudomonas sp.]